MEAGDTEEVATQQGEELEEAQEGKADESSASEKLERKLKDLGAADDTARTDEPLVERGMPGVEAAAREVSAATIGRMLGLATTADLKLMEGKLDLLSTRVNNLTVRMEKVASILGNAPTGKDMERIDVHLSSLMVMVKDAMKSVTGEEGDSAPRPDEAQKKSDRAISTSKIVTNTD